MSDWLDETQVLLALSRGMAVFLCGAYDAHGRDLDEVIRHELDNAGRWSSVAVGVSGPTYTRTIDGLTFQVTATHAPGIAAAGRNYVTVREGYALAFDTVYADEKGRQELERILDSVRFSR